LIDTYKDGNYYMEMIFDERPIERRRLARECSKIPYSHKKFIKNADNKNHKNNSIQRDCRLINNNQDLFAYSSELRTSNKIADLEIELDLSAFLTSTQKFQNQQREKLRTLKFGVR